MRPRALRRRLALIGFGGMLICGLATAGLAKADGLISGSESAFITAFGESVVCGTLDDSPTIDTVLGIGVFLIGHEEFSPGDAADIINYSVALYCPEFGDLLERVHNSGDERRVVA